MILLTLGTYPLAFDRLIETIDGLCGEGAIDDEVFGQIGYANYLPKNFRFEKLMDKEAFDATLASASAIIGHAGMGTIIQALDCGKPLLVVPRLRKYREIVNDHQVETARKFEALGHVLAAYEMGDVREKIRGLAAFTPTPRAGRPQLVARRIGDFLSTL